MHTFTFYTYNRIDQAIHILTIKKKDRERRQKVLFGDQIYLVCNKLYIPITIIRTDSNTTASQAE